MNSWNREALSEFAEINPRRPSSLRDLPDSFEVTFVPMPVVDEFSGTLTKAEVRTFLDVRKGFTYFSEGDVIFAKITPCMQNGKCAIATGLQNGLGFGSTEFHVIHLNPEKSLPEWIWFFLRQHWF